MLQKTIPGRPTTNTVQLAPEAPMSNIQMKPPQPPQQPANSNFVPSSNLGTPMHGHHHSPTPPPLQAGDGRIISRHKLQELSRSMDGSDLLEDDAIELLILIADEFVDSVTNFACK